MADIRSYFQGLDLDTGGGTDLVLGVSLRLSASGGAIEAIGQKTMAVSIPVVIASDQTSVAVTADTELPAAGALAENLANPTTPLVGACLLGFDGTAWDRIYTVADADAYAAGTKGFLMFGQNGTTNYQALSVDSTGALNVVVGSVTNPVISAQTSAALAAGAAAALSTAEAAAKKLRKVIVWSTVAIKVTLTTVDNAVESGVKAVGGAQAFNEWVYDDPSKAYITLGTTAGLDAFRANITNLDDANAADVYATFYYED